MRILLLVLPLLAAAAPPDPGQQLLEAIHRGDTHAVRAALKAGASPNTKATRGATVLMHAAAYAPADAVQALLEAGADVNSVSDAGFTPLMWAASDPAKLKLLLAKGADIKAHSKDGNSALILARQNGFTKSIPVLLAAGAPDEDGMNPAWKPSMKASRDHLLKIHSIGPEPMHAPFRGEAMFDAVYTPGADLEPLRAMLDAGADANSTAQIVTVKLPALSMAAAHGNTEQVQELLARGADPNRKGTRGITPLIAATVYEFQDPALVQALLSKGAAIDALDESGRTALDWALLQGDTEIVKLLRGAGAHAMAAAPASPAPVATPLTPRAAVEKAVALLEPTEKGFFAQSGGCISCHNVTLPAFATHRALTRKFNVKPEGLDYANRATIATWTPDEENLATGASSVGGLVANVGYGLAIMAETGYKPTFVTDAGALALLRLQLSNGSWEIPDIRPPLGGRQPLEMTALTIRALKAYTPAGLAADRDAAIKRATDFILKSSPRTSLDQTHSIFGLHWAGLPVASLAPYRDKLLASQREDGGWSSLPTLGSEAFATGEALYALELAGAKSSPAYKRGVDYLLRTQMPDGSWYMRARGLAFQPYQETGFPYGHDQFISSAATSWAAIALAGAENTR
jgi:ankyrin repeat protein